MNTADFTKKYVETVMLALDSIDKLSDARQANIHYAKERKLLDLLKTDHKLQEDVIPKLLDDKNPRVCASIAMAVLQIDAIAFFPQAIDIIENCANRNDIGSVSSNCIITLDIHWDKISKHKKGKIKFPWRRDENRT